LARNSYIKFKKNIKDNYKIQPILTLNFIHKKLNINLLWMFLDF